MSDEPRKPGPIEKLINDVLASATMGAAAGALSAAPGGLAATGAGAAEVAF